jgi:hypothetical protein
MITNGRIIQILLGICYITLNSYVINAMENIRWKECHTQRLPQVDGDHGKKNDIIFCGQLKQAVTNVIFFSGDVQVCFLSS